MKTRVGETKVESDSGEIDKLFQAPVGWISVLTAVGN